MMSMTLPPDQVALAKLLEDAANLAALEMHVRVRAREGASREVATAEFHARARSIEG